MKFLFNKDVGCLLFPFYPFLETMLSFENLVSRIFLKHNRFCFQKNDVKNIDRRQKEMVGKMHKIIKQLSRPFK